MKLRAFHHAAIALAALLSFLPSRGGARVLQVSASFQCPDATVCDCPGSPGTCFKFFTINGAMAAAVASDSILVTAGFYGESVGLKNGVKLLGGYNATFTARNPGANLTMIHGGGTAPAVFTGSGVGNTSLVDGFTLSGGGGSPGCGVLIRGGAPVFRNNRIVNTQLAGIAGGVYISQGSNALLENNVIADNSTQGSGGGVRADFSSPTLNGNTIERNRASHSGAGIYVVGGSVSATSNIIRDNVAGDGGGGGAYLQEATSATEFEGNDFINNSGAFGGGVMVKDQSSATFTDNDFTNNVAAQSGGGIAVIGQSDVTLTSNRFVDCVAQASHGGGMYVLSSEANVTGLDATTPTPDASFVRCETPGNGGGFFAFASSGVISGIRMQDCESDSAGGGIFVGRSVFTISENLIVDCTAFDAGGVAIYFNNQSNELATTCPMYANTLYGCTATNEFEAAGSVGLYGNFNAFVAQLSSNIIAFTRQGSALRCKRAPPGPPQAATLTFTCSTVHLDPGNTTIPDDAVAGTNCDSAYLSDGANRTGDPKFCSAVSGNFALQECSPDANAGCDHITSLPNGQNRGVPYANDCACVPLLSLEAASWGRIKASYR